MVSIFEEDPEGREAITGIGEIEEGAKCSCLGPLLTKSLSQIKGGER
jgi:hypothetical protein